jgi:hypothetical protein
VIYNSRVTTALSAAAARSEGERVRQLTTIVALAEALDMRAQFDPRVVDAFIRLLVRADPTVMSTVWERTSGVGRARLAASERRASCQPDAVTVQA